MRVHPLPCDHLLPVCHVAQIEDQRRPPWLIENLFLENSVGITAGAPKAMKTWLALDVALSVATKTPVVGTYAVPAAGAVLLFAAEDTPQAVRTRLNGMAAQRGTCLDEAPIHLVIASSLRLDRRDDQQRLEATVAQLQPKLLVLDPFVRLCRVDENSSLEVSTVLAYLRQLQRELAVSILVVHHTRKASPGNGRAGLALRGSGDFWAWSDTTMYLRRRDEAVHLQIEHRGAADPEPLCLELDTTSESGPYLRVQAPAPSDTGQHSPVPIGERILACLAERREPCRTEKIRDALRVRMQTLVNELRQLESSRRICRGTRGWRLVDGLRMPGETESGSAGMQPNKG
jgi:hypothetical protein